MLLPNQRGNSDGAEVHGQKIEYGQLLGRQSNKAPPGVRVGLHTHIDFNEWQINHFCEYFRDLDSGTITPEGRIDEYKKRDGRRLQMDSERPADRWLGNGERHNDPSGYDDPRHPDHALYESIRRQLPSGISDEMAAHITLEAKIGGVTQLRKLDEVIVQGGTAFVAGKTPGDMAIVDLCARAPSMQDTLQRSEAFDRQQAVDLAQFMEQQRTINERGPAMELRGLGRWS